MSKIKSVSQFEDGIWGTETPIGADASNVDVEMSDSSTKDLQTVLGDIPSAAAPIQSQINTKVTASGGNIGNTTVSSGIQNFDSSSSETSTELLDTSVRVTNATEVTSSMWTKFNRFRKRVDNKFKDVFLSSVEDVASPSDYKTYSQSALNDYFANVVGYASASDLPDATSTIAQQLSTLNNNVTSLNNKTTNATTTKAGLMSASDKTILDGLNTRSHVSITYAFGTIYLEKYGHSCMCGHWPTSISAIKTAYTYTGIIPEIYRPMSDVRFVAWDANHWDVQHFIQITTNGNVIVTCNVAGNIALHYSASWVASNI